MNPEVDFYFDEAKRWQEEQVKLRRIALGCGLTKELKWGVPCYTVQKKNIVLIHALKNIVPFYFSKVPY